jgi:hypothetical protein
MRLLSFIHRNPCHLTPYASQFGALKASLDGDRNIPNAHRCEHCANRWHAGPAPTAVAA